MKLAGLKVGDTYISEDGTEYIVGRNGGLLNKGGNVGNKGGGYRKSFTDIINEMLDSEHPFETDSVTGRKLSNKEVLILNHMKAALMEEDPMSQIKIMDFLSTMAKENPAKPAKDADEKDTQAVIKIELKLNNVEGESLK